MLYWALVGSFSSEIIVFWSWKFSCIISLITYPLLSLYSLSINLSVVPLNWFSNNLVFSVLFMCVCVYKYFFLSSEDICFFKGMKKFWLLYFKSYFVFWSLLFITSFFCLISLKMLTIFSLIFVLPFCITFFPKGSFSVLLILVWKTRGVPKSSGAYWLYVKHQGTKMLLCLVRTFRTVIFYCMFFGLFLQARNV